jgi:exodeoxyribonuclease VIII
MSAPAKTEQPAQHAQPDSWPEYAAIPAVNWSTLREMRRSPLHYQWRLRNPRPDTKATALGRAVHAAVFEAFRFSGEFVQWRGKVRRGREWDAFRDLNAASTILLPREYETACAIRDALAAHADVQPYRERGIGEHTIRWIDPATGIECKARLDWVSYSQPSVCDLKTTRDIAERQFSSSAARFGYHGQMAHYLRGWHVLHGERLPGVFHAVESEPPHDAVVYVADEDLLTAGDDEVTELLEKVARCRDADKWPGMYEGPQTLRMPPWYWGDDADAVPLEDIGLTFSKAATTDETDEEPA